ncbi:hypothetical protein Q9R46_09150 [Paenibacillus sp. RRE4]|uniref:hypothetical protein n=1 Tax=Paenibacillus sp. RRE4 TaxID=2962587 RepID=UPI00288267A4|nr:hypothetical protein [Paenibacillus sp. RRE4]MDT0122807.1 hypothetical protein [Paenibacillus sp. RRE4]
MNLFYVQSIVDGVSKVKSFLEDNYIGIPWSALGDLEQASSEELRELLEQRYGLVADKSGEVLQSIQLFAHGMSDGDYVVIKDEDWMYVGDLGDYYYDDSIGTSDDLICHRRGVTWLGRVPLEEINEHMQTLLHDPNVVAQFRLPVTQARLDQALRGNSNATGIVETEDHTPARVDQSTIEAALQVLKEALKSKDERLRVQAATAILQYAK